MIMYPYSIVKFQKGGVFSLKFYNAIPVIAFVQAGELPRWRGEQFQHAVVISGLSDEAVWLLDPEGQAQPEAVPLAGFMLAWAGMDYRCAAISSRMG